MLSHHFLLVTSAADWIGIADMPSLEMEQTWRAFLDAPFVEDGWMTALRGFASATRSSRAQLVGIGDTVCQFNVMTDIDPAYQQEFIEMQAWRPDVSWRVALSGDPFEVLSERHYDAAKAAAPAGSYDDYDDHCHKWGGGFGAQTVLHREGSGLIGLAILRDEKGGRTREADRRVFTEGAKYALAAVRIQRSMAHRGEQLVTGTLESMGLAAFLLDRNGRVTAKTPQAEALLGQDHGDVLRLTGTRLGATRSDGELQAAIARALAPDIAPAAYVQQLWLDAAREAAVGMRCEVIRLPQREYLFGFGVRLMVVVHPATDLSGHMLGSMRQALDLTVAEAQIARRLADGASREQIAAERATSVQTLTTQIKSILRKGDVTREAELVALVNRLMR